MTGGHALEVPFEGRSAGFIEVIDIEDEAAIRGSVGTEVAHVGIAADLRDDAGVGQRSEVSGHDRHSAAEEAEGRSEHAFVLQRDQRRDASAHGARDGGHRRNAAGRRAPVRVLLSAELFPARLAQRVPLRGRDTGCHT